MKFPPWVVLAISAIVLGLGSGFLLFGGDGPWGPLDFHNPQIVLAPQSDLRPGGSVVVQGTKCNNSSDDVAVTAETYWRDEATRKLIPRSIGAPGVELPGCHTSTYRNAIPADLPPGTYVLIGYERGFRDHDTQLEPWFTVPFTVMPAATPAPLGTP